jgi:prepilin-type N-terminal cleavage/methylation domain-containing protein
MAAQGHLYVRRGFSLIELVIVVVIIGIIAAIAIPRMSRGASGAQESALASSLASMRNAIDLYYTEHGNTFPAVLTFANQMTLFSDDAGATNATKTTQYIYGPYLRSIPPLPVGAKKGKTGVAAADAGTIGWIYDASTGIITANTTAGEIDSRGVAFNTY